MGTEPKPFIQLVVGLLGFTGGFADATSFLRLGGVFTAHITGNLVLLVAQLTKQDHEGAFLRILVLPIFAVAVAASYEVGSRARARGTSPAAALLLVEGSLLAIAGALAIALGRQIESRPARVAVCVSTVLAMGVQNAMMRFAYGGQLSTSAMTGNLTQLVIDAMRLFDRRQETIARAAAWIGLRRASAVTMGFVIGAAAGATTTHYVGAGALLLPAAIVLGLATREVGATRRPPAAK